MKQNIYYKNNDLCIEQVLIKDLMLTYDSPTYFYSQNIIKNNYLKFHTAFKNYPHKICYSVKANSNLTVLNILVKLGAGFDVVSIGELKRVIAAGGDTSKCIFSGVGKKSTEIEFALTTGIYCFNVESNSELKRIATIATKLKIIAPISIRVNPNVDAKTHPYIATGLKENKFGVDVQKADNLYQFIHQHQYLSVRGVDCHIGSQITDKKPFLNALDKLLVLIKKLKQQDINLSHIDLGGGIGINYEDNKTIDIKQYIKDIIQKAAGLEIILEPGRAIVGDSGIFVTKVEFLKQNEHKSFAIVDGGMNDLLRPALYHAHHSILPVNKNSNGINASWDIVGPVCESADYFGKNRKITIKQGDYLALMSAGAYCFVMSSNYNSRPMAAEVLINNNQHKLIRKRQTIQNLFELEVLNELN